MVLYTELKEMLQANNYGLTNQEFEDNTQGEVNVRNRINYCIYWIFYYFLFNPLKARI